MTVSPISGPVVSCVAVVLAGLAGDACLGATSTAGPVAVADDARPACHAVTGRIVGGRTAGVQFNRHSFRTDDSFVTRARDGRFALCLPAGDYTAVVTGELVSLGAAVSVPAQATVELHGYPAGEVRTPPRSARPTPHDLDELVADIAQSGARMIGLGEATHGSAELVTRRAELTFALARRAQLRLVLLEVDAISAFALDRYVQGGAIDPARAVASLGYWISDTHELLQFLGDVRAYNQDAPAAARLHVGGIDVQNTERPVALVLDHAASLKLTAEEQALLPSVAAARARPVRQLSPARRAALDALLARLSVPRGPAEIDTQIAVAARSLAIQVGFQDGDVEGMYDERRDAGMAQLASFLVETTGAPRACLWAHADHIGRRAEGSRSMGQRLAAAHRYYPIGFLFFEGSSRAWDPEGKIGVIPHALAPAPAFTVEAAAMAATGAPDVAWLAVHHLPTELRAWLDTPRFVRELGAVYAGEDRALILTDVPSAFDALVVIRTVHDSTPTPTGVRP